MKSTMNISSRAQDSAERLQQQLERAHQTAALGEQLFMLAQAHTTVPGLHQRARTTFAFQHGSNRRATTTVEVVAPDEVSVTAKRLTAAQAGAVLAALLPEQTPKPSTIEPTNADRAGWAEKAADVFAALTWGDETFRSVAVEDRAYVLSDLLTNIMHLAAAEGMNWTDIVSRATVHWNAEVCKEHDYASSDEQQPMEHIVSPRLTKQAYTRQRAELVTRKLALEADIAQIIRTQCSHEYEGLNEKHDAVYDLQVMIDDLDNQWHRRNWTATDYAAHALSSSNVD